MLFVKNAWKCTSQIHDHEIHSFFKIWRSILVLAEIVLPTVDGCRLLFHGYGQLFTRYTSLIKKIIGTYYYTFTKNIFNIRTMANFNLPRGLKVSKMYTRNQNKVIKSYPKKSGYVEKTLLKMMKIITGHSGDDPCRCKEELWLGCKIDLKGGGGGVCNFQRRILKPLDP